MKTPIDPKNIRAGDLIRWESATRHGTANEYRATGGEGDFMEQGRLYLLDRPKPVVDIPSTPTLGWIDATAGGTSLAVVGIGNIGYDLDKGPHYARVRRGGGWDLSSEITAFTEAVAVPKAALYVLRAAVLEHGADGPTRNFLTAIDNAGDPK